MFFLVLLAFLAQKIIHVGYWISIITTCPLVEYFASPTSNIQLIRVVRKIFSRQQYAPKKWCALNNDVHLITRFYSISMKRVNHVQRQLLESVEVHIKT